MLTEQFFNTTNVLEKVKDRISFIFDNFESINVSISGGKDSTVLAHLALKEANKRNRKVGLFFLDEEIIYQSTVEQVEYLMSLYPKNTNRLWLQIEFGLTSAISMNENVIKCWEKGKSKKWMRKKSSKNIVNKPWDENNEKYITGYKFLDFYGVVKNFESIYKNTAFLIGLRAVESMNRWHTVTKYPVKINNKKIFYGTKIGHNYKLYPIFDWHLTDIWKYIYENKLKYSKIYDFYFRKKTPINEMRVSSLVHEKSFKSLCDLPEFEPKTYDKLLKRCKGISFVNETGKNAKMFKVRKLPKNYTSWIIYRDFLISTYPDQSKKIIFKKRFSSQLNNEYVARQQCRQLILTDTENNLPIDNKPDPREELIQYLKSVL